MRGKLEDNSWLQDPRSSPRVPTWPTGRRATLRHTGWGRPRKQRWAARAWQWRSRQTGTPPQLWGNPACSGWCWPCSGTPHLDTGHRMKTWGASNTYVYSHFSTAQQHIRAHFLLPPDRNCFVFDFLLWHWSCADVASSLTGKPATGCRECRGTDILCFCFEERMVLICLCCFHSPVEVCYSSSDSSVSKVIGKNCESGVWWTDKTR